MKRYFLTLAILCFLLTNGLASIAQSEKTERQKIPGMGNLLIPTVIKATDNSTSIVLDGIPAENRQIQVVPENLELTTDIVFHNSTNTEGQPLLLKMDVVRPKDEKKYPAVIYITGGGFMWAPKNSNLYNRCEIAKAGFVVGSIEYHVVSNGLYSDAVADVKAAIRFLRANADKFGIDPEKMAVWGESAGGYLTAMTGTSNGIQKFETGENLDQSSAVQAAIDVYGLSDLTKIGADYDKEAEEAHFTTDAPEAGYVHGKNGGLTILDKPEVVAQSNPVNYVDKNDPAFLFIHGSADQLVSPSQTLLVHNALRKAGVTSKRFVITGANHGGPHFSDPQVIGVMVDFLNNTLK